MDFIRIPDQTAEGDTWAVARKLAYEGGTLLHKVADGLGELFPIYRAYAIAMAQDRVIGADPIRMRVRAIADYLGVDYKFRNSNAYS